MKIKDFVFAIVIGTIAATIVSSCAAIKPFVQDVVPTAICGADILVDALQNEDENQIAADSVVRQACTTAITDGETTFIAIIEDVISGTALPAVQKLDSYKQTKLNVAKRKK